jgi:serine/threonine-protein kinase
VLATAALIGLCLYAPRAAWAAEVFGAIAYSPSTAAIGWGFDYPSREAAESGAIANCSQHASDCAIATWFRDACGAIAIGKGGYGAEWGEDAPAAEGAALARCRSHAANCTLRRSVCTSP